MKKLLFINPASKVRRGFLHWIGTRFPPLQYGILAALTPDDWEVEILDENFDEFQLKEADLVGLTGYTSSIYRTYEIASLYKEKKIPVVIGGIHASMLPKEAIQYADSVVVGEAESIWKKLLYDFDNRQMKRFYHGERQSLDHVPQARHELFHKDYIVGSTFSTRGCPFDCNFCTVTAFNGSKYRMRPVENVLNEIEAIPQDRFFFIDDNLIGYSKKSRDHAKAIFRGMIDRGINKQWWSQASINFADDPEVLKLAFESGCRLIFLGIESEKIEGLENTNKQLNMKVGVDKYEVAFKKIHDAGISVLGSFIFGLDSDGVQDLVDRRNYIINSSLDCYQSTILTPLPGTITYKEIEKAGRITKKNYPYDWQFFSGQDVVFKPANMTAKELEETMKDNWYELFSKKTITRKFIQTLRSTKNSDSATWALSTNIAYRNYMTDLYGDENFSIESLIGPMNPKGIDES